MDNGALESANAVLDYSPALHNLCPLERQVLCILVYTTLGWPKWRRGLAKSSQKLAERVAEAPRRRRLECSGTLG